MLNTLRFDSVPNPFLSGIENAWILTREKLAPGTVLQKAYGVLDKYKLSRTFFVKTDQNSCEIAEAAENSSENPSGNSSSPVKKPQKKVGQKKGEQSTGREEVVKTDEVADAPKSDTVVVPDQKIVVDQKVGPEVVSDQKVVAPEVVADQKVAPVEQKVVPVEQKVVPVEQKVGRRI